jgi:hypothetical protein
MGRPKRKNPLVPVVRSYVQERYPELTNARLSIRRLDGPPGSPRYAASLELCDVTRCPFHVGATDVEAGHCPHRDCQLREALRLLLDRNGTVVQVHQSHLHWG